MGRTSTINLLPEDIQSQLIEWLTDKSITIDEATERTNALLDALELDDLKVTRSAVGRKNKALHEKIERVGREMRQAQAASKSFYERFGNENLDEAGRYSAEMLQGFIFKIHLALSEIDDISPEEAFAHSKTIKNLAGAIGALEKALSENKSRLDLIRRQAAAKAADAMEAEAKKHNVGEDQTLAMRKAITTSLADG